MHRLDRSLGLILLFLLFVSATIGASSGQDSLNGGVALNQLVLNIYVDEAGRALINGYVDDPKSLEFLDLSEFTYENDTGQIYAITGAMTSKSRDNWTLNFVSKSSYDEYQILIYLPANAKLRRVDCSSGLDYLVSTANDSVIVDVQGSDITKPVVDVRYVLSLSEATSRGTNTVEDISTDYPYKTIALLFIVAAFMGLLFFLLRSRSKSLKPEASVEHYDHKADHAKLNPEQPDLSVQIDTRVDASSLSMPQKEDLNGDLKDTSRMSESSKVIMTDERRNAGAELTSEISAVMETLTDKERSIVKALLRRGGTMTQTEIKYELDISKSSLSGILTALEKRKIITKKEKGRTNVIELSAQFLNLQERS
jgi:uncharacterized membrane protein